MAFGIVAKEVLLVYRTELMRGTSLRRASEVAHVAVSMKRSSYFVRASALLEDMSHVEKTVPSSAYLRGAVKNLQTASEANGLKQYVANATGKPVSLAEIVRAPSRIRDPIARIRLAFTKMLDEAQATRAKSPYGVIANPF